MTTTRCKYFLRVCGMCLSHVWYYFFGYCFLYGTWLLVGCDDYIICTTNWFIKIYLEFRKWLVYKHFILKDTKLLLQFPWLSRKQSTVFISCNSNLVFFNLFNSVCKHWFTSLSQFCLLEGAQQMFFVFIRQDYPFRDVGHSFHSSVLLVELNCPLQIIKALSTLDSNFATEGVLGKCIQTVLVLVVETGCIQFL